MKGLQHKKIKFRIHPRSRNSKWEQPLLYKEVIHHKLKEIIYWVRHILYLSKSREKNQLAEYEATADG